MEEPHQLVRHHYTVDEDKLHIMAQKSEYWASSEAFWIKTRNKRIAWMSEAQRGWLEKIEVGLIEAKE